MTKVTGWLAAFAAAVAAAGMTQQAIPVRQLSPAEATSAAPIGFGTAIELSDGRVLYNDRGTFGNPRLFLFDAALATPKTVGDSTTLTTGSRRNYGFVAIPFRADSTVLADPNGNTLIVLDANGKNANVMTMPRPTDAGSIAAGNGFDQKMRLIFRGSFPRPPLRPAPGGAFSIPPLPDTFPIVRADFDSRAIDTLATIRLVTGQSVSTSMSPSAPNRMLTKIVRQPLPTTDDWTVLSDGTVAIVRGQDYHVDWIHPDGTKSSTLKMAFDWRRVTDEEKQHIVDSLLARDAKDKIRSDSVYAARGQTSPLSSIATEYVPLKEMPDYYPPIRTGSVVADRDANLWILPTTSTQAKGGLLYDVVNARGGLFERVQLPHDCALAGFGNKSAIYLACSEKAAGDTASKTFLKRMRILRPTTKSQHN